MGRVLAVGVSLIFVLALPPTLLLRSLNGTIFDPIWTQQALSSDLLGSGALQTVVVRNVIPAAIQEEENELLRRITANLSEQDWQRIIRVAVPGGWLEEQIGEAVAGLLDWLDSNDPAPSILVNTEPVKRRLIGAGTRETVAILVASWPPCAEKEIAQLEGAFRAGAELPFLICQPPEPYRGVLVGFVSEALQREARDLPSQVDLGQQLTGKDLADLLEFKRQARNLSLLARWGLLVPLALLGLNMAFAVRSLRDWFRWWGLPLALGGAMTALMAGVARARSAALAADWTADLATSTVLVSALRTMLTELLRTSAGRAAVMGLFALGLGLVLLLASVFLPGGTGGDPKLKVPASSVGRRDRPSGMFG